MAPKVKQKIFGIKINYTFDNYSKGNSFSRRLQRKALCLSSVATMPQRFCL
jgi:hypothetical protein